MLVSVVLVFLFVDLVLVFVPILGLVIVIRLVHSLFTQRQQERRICSSQVLMPRVEQVVVVVVVVGENKSPKRGDNFVVYNNYIRLTTHNSQFGTQN